MSVRAKPFRNECAPIRFWSADARARIRSTTSILQYIRVYSGCVDGGDVSEGKFKQSHQNDRLE